MTNFLEKLKQNRYLSSFLTEEAFVQLRRYAIIGLSAFALEYFSYIILLSYISLNISHSISMTFGFILSFTLNRLWSFKSTGNITKQFIYMIILFLINLRISNIIIGQLTVSLKIHAFISKLLVMGLIILWNFIIFKKIIYRN